VAWLGDCDEGCEMLADKLGWGVSCTHWQICTITSVAYEPLSMNHLCHFLWYHLHKGVNMLMKTPSIFPKYFDFCHSLPPPYYPLHKTLSA
jgi:hypothetical protein